MISCISGTIFLLSLAAAQAPEPPWTSYEDQFIRFQYPAEFMVVRTTDSPKKVWSAGRPSLVTPGMPEMRGSYTVFGHYDGNEKRPLKDILSERIWSSIRRIDVKGFAPEGADCIAARAEDANSSDCIGRDGKLKMRDACYSAYVETRCRGKAGDLFEVYIPLGEYERIYPPPQPVEDAYSAAERFLRSLEFK